MCRLPVCVPCGVILVPSGGSPHCIVQVVDIPTHWLIWYTSHPLPHIHPHTHTPSHTYQPQAPVYTYPQMTQQQQVQLVQRLTLIQCLPAGQYEIKKEKGSEKKGDKRE